MKALILAGGKGTRLRPITYTAKKELIPVANKPIIFYGIEAIRDAGIRDIGMIVGENKEEVMGLLGNVTRLGINITYIEQPDPLGLAHAVKIAEPFLQQEPFIMYLGDNILRDGVIEFVRAFKKKTPNALILLTRVKNPQAFGVAELNNNRVFRLVEKPKHPRSDLALVGVYLFDKNIFKAVNNIQPSWRNELEITDAIQWLIDHGYTVDSHLVTGWWKDTGKPEDVLHANRLTLETLETQILGTVDEHSTVSGRVAIGAGSQILFSTIRGPVIIGSKCKIVNSYIGPFTSIADQVSITNSEIENSIIMKETEISDIEGRIDESLIGQGVSITNSNMKPRAYKLILGDKSTVKMG